MDDKKANPVHILNVIFISVILFLHHSCYTNNYFDVIVDYKINKILQKFAVGGFFFFSGYKLATSNFNIPILLFWKKRFFRIYILYVIALCVAIITYFPYFNNGDYPTFKNIIIHLFCLQMFLPEFFGPTVNTLWFVSVLFFCYLFFAVFRRAFLNLKKSIIISLATFIITSAAYRLTSEHGFHLFSINFSIYFMFFSLGMIYSKFGFFNFSNPIIIIAFFVCSSFLTLMLNIIYINTFYELYIFSMLVIVGNTCAYVAIYDIAKKLPVSVLDNFFILKFSFASYCIFLFHRSIWHIMALNYQKGTFLQWVFIVPIGIPVIIFLCFLIQKAYNLLLGMARPRVSRGLAEARR